MARAASFFKWFASAVWTILIVPFLSLAWSGVLDRGDVANHPVDWAMGWLASFAQVPGIATSALIATGVLVGVWIDWLLRKLDGSREGRRITLGIQFCDLSSAVEDRLDRFGYGQKFRGQQQQQWGSYIYDLDAALMSAFIKAGKFGLWTPTNLYKREDGGFLLVHYLRLVGTMLRDGHFKEAKRHASGFMRSIENSKS